MGLFRTRNSVSPDEVLQVAQQRATALRPLAFAELAELPPTHDETVPIKESQIAVCTYRDTLPNGSIRIVVQAYLNRFLGIGTMTADGLIIASDGVQTPIPEEMLLEFI